jgi:hypothetical protein
VAFLTPDPRHLGRPDADIAGRDATLPPAARYRRWDGSQAIPDLTAGEIVDALADDVLEQGDVREALRRLMERGLRSDDPSRGDLHGLRDLLDRLRTGAGRSSIGASWLILADVRRSWRSWPRSAPGCSAGSRDRARRGAGRTGDGAAGGGDEAAAAEEAARP